MEWSGAEWSVDSCVLLTFDAVATVLSLVGFEPTSKLRENGTAIEAISYDYSEVKG